MPAPSQGARNRGQHIYLPGRTSGGIKRELVQVESFTVNQATTGTATTQRTPDSRVRNIPAEDGVATVSIQLRYQSENPDHRALLDGTVQLEFVQDEIVLEDPDSAARVAIATSGEVTFSGSGNASAGGVGDMIQVGGKDHPIVAVWADGAAAGDVSPFAKADINEVLSSSDNKVFVAGTLSNAQSAAAYKIVRGETTTGSMSGTCSGPKLAGVGADYDGYRVSTIVFTPTAGLLDQLTPSAKRPAYS